MGVADHRLPPPARQPDAACASVPFGRSGQQGRRTAEVRG